MTSAIIIVSGSTASQKAYGSQTGTLPVIRTGQDSKQFSRGTKDNGTLPVIIVPSNPNPNGDGGNGFGTQTYTVTITLNQPTTDNQVLILSSSNPKIAFLDDTATVPVGSSTVTTSFTVPYSHHNRHKEVKFSASCNGGSVDCSIRVHYRNEEG